MFFFKILRLIKHGFEKNQRKVLRNGGRRIKQNGRDNILFNIFHAGRSISPLRTKIMEPLSSTSSKLHKTREYLAILRSYGLI